MKKSVCALVVTYNRKDYLKKLIINGLLKQTYLIDKIIIFDNHSSDGTAEMLKNIGLITSYKCGELSENVFKDKRILYFYNGTNEGGSAGFHNGIKIAYEQNCQLIWAMDDDVLPESNCLERLVENISENSRICVPCRTDKNFSDYAIVDLNMANPFLYSLKSRKKKVYSSEIAGNSISIKDMPFEGPLFDRSIIGEIGLPKKDLFLFFDDTEYAYRALFRTDIQYIKNAVLHKQIISKKTKHTPLGWRDYYSLRNQYWFDRNYGKNILVKNVRPLYSCLFYCVKAILIMQFGNIKVIKKAYNDGKKSILGKTVEPGDKV